MRTLRVAVFAGLCGDLIAPPPATAVEPATYKEKVLWSFGKGSDGQYPSASLVDVNGKLYGTTYTGGIGCGSAGCGRVFSIDPNIGASGPMALSICRTSTDAAAKEKRLRGGVSA
jgi:uncharacterized repeat protein (TIGR03803 family)